MGATDGARGELRRVLLLTLGVKALVLGLLLTAWWNTPMVSHLVQDLRTWQEFFAKAREGLVPYAHFSKEYPVLAGALYWLMAPLVDPADLRRIVLVHGAFMVAADLVNAALFFRAVRAIAPGLAFPLTAALNLNLTALVTGALRYESWVVTFVLLGYLAHRRGRFQRAGLWWTIGANLKWYPLFFLAAQEWRLLVVERRRWHWAVSGALVAAVTAAVNLPFMIAAVQETGSLANWAAAYVFHATRPLYWDTLLGVGQLWLGPLPWERYAGLWSLGLMLAAVVARPRMALEDKGVLVCLAALVFNRIYSAQFHLWFYPLLLLGAARADPSGRRTRLVLFGTLDLLNVLVYPVAFTGAVAELSGFTPFAARWLGGDAAVLFSLAIAARTLAVLALAAAILRRPLRT